MGWKKAIAAMCTFAASVTSNAVATEANMQDLLVNFDFDTGRIAIIPPEGVSPDPYWSVGFVVQMGNAAAESDPIHLTWTDTDAALFPIASRPRDAFIMRVVQEEVGDAQQTLDQYHQLKEMVGGDLKVQMVLSAGFHIDADQTMSVCFGDSKAPMDVWVKSSEASEWRKLGTDEDAGKLSNFVGSALRSSCPAKEA